MTKNIEDDFEYDLLKLIDVTTNLIKTAKRNHKSIRGTNSYATKFLEHSVKAKEITNNIQTKLHGLVDDEVLKQLSENIDAYFAPNNNDPLRRTLQRELLEIFKTKIQPHLNGKKLHSPTDELFPLELVKDTKPYIEKIAMQASGCYDQNWFDGCAVMMRRLLENLIIECFESKKIVEKIKNDNKNFYYLSDLIPKFLAEDGKNWNPSRNCKISLPNLKDLGDKSAHSRYFTARQQDLKDIKKDFRIVIEELVNIAQLK